jgi:signal transduction histidine kinase
LRGTFDPDRVMQCLGNLVGNALQHGEDPIVVEASECDDRRAVITRVTNRGDPLPPEVLRKCFEPFVSSGAPRAGLGLGLYIVGEIARAHGATCDVSSDEAATSFVIRWPRTPRSETPHRP